MADIFPKSGDPDRTPHDAASYIGLHCLLIILFGSPQIKMGSFIFALFVLPIEL